MSQPSPIAPPIPKAGAFRWVICGLLFLATTINYVDRQVFSLLKETLKSDLSWDEVDFGNVVASFQFAYALGYLFTGRLMDRLGVRWGLTLAVAVWSLASGLHGLMSSVLGFCVARACLGLAEGGNFPAAVKTVGEWFPRRERALATGVFNSGSNVGIIAAAFTVPWITAEFGWRYAFLATAAIGLLWLFAWLPLYRQVEKHPWVSKREADYILSDPPDPPTPIAWIDLLGYRETWAFAIAMFLVTPVWIFYLNWIPGFLQERHHLDLLSVSGPLIAVYLMADVGSVGGGWFSSYLIGRGRGVVASRLIAMFVCALAVIPVYATTQITSLWWVVAIVGLAAAAHQGFNANLYTIVTDTMPRSVASSVVGVGGLTGSIGGALYAVIVGQVLKWTHDYQWLFVWASASYLLAVTCLYVLLTPLPLREGEGEGKGGAQAKRK